MSTPLPAAEKWALLVGVNDYIKGPPAWHLRGCENDVAMTRELLVGKFGFPPEHIKTLLNGEATTQHILQAIQDWLVAPTHPEDMVYFHFSGHGSQAVDQDGDEDDGMDELICPTDLQQGQLSSVITDDQLKEAFARIPARQVTIVLDACHSGTGTRDLSLSRPRFVEFEPGVKKAAREIVAVPAVQGKDKLAGSGGMEGSGKQQVTLSGCRPDQTSADAWIREGFYAGALTYYLIENMRKAPPDMTCRLGTSGKITVLFPNQYRPDGFIQGGKVYQTGTKGEMPFQIRATGPAGRELVKAIATLKPLDLVSLRMGETGGAGTRSIESSSDFVRRLPRDLAAVPLNTEGSTVTLPTDRWSTDYLIVETTVGGGLR